MGYEPIGRIRPVAPSPSILTASRPLPNVEWRSGVAWSTSCQVSYGLRFCPPEVAREDRDDGFVAHSSPFMAYTPMLCDFPADGPDLEAFVRDQTEVHTAAAIGAALWKGVSPYRDDLVVYDPADLEQVTLRRYATDVSSDSGPLDLDDGVSSLLTHYAICTGGNGGAILHMPQALMPYVLGGGAGGARLGWPEGNNYRGPLGSLVSPGPGYPEGRSVEGPDGNGPLLAVADDVETYAGNEAGAAWIYVSGPVEYATTPIRVVPEEDRDRIPFRTNLYELWGERNAIVRFDPCCVFAIEVVNPSPLPEVS